jgi:hypothetical protein
MSRIHWGFDARSKPLCGDQKRVGRRIKMWNLNRSAEPDSLEP